MFVSPSLQAALAPVVANAINGLLNTVPAQAKAARVEVPSLLVNYGNEEDPYTLIGFDPNQYTVTVLNMDANCQLEEDYEDDEGTWSKVDIGHGSVQITVKIRDMDRFSEDYEIVIPDGMDLIMSVYAVTQLEDLEFSDMQEELVAAYSGKPSPLGLVYWEDAFYLKLD